MKDSTKPIRPEAEPSVDATSTRTRKTYEPPQCEKKRSIHRVTLISGMGVMSMSALSAMGSP